MRNPWYLWVLQSQSEGIQNFHEESLRSRFFGEPEPFGPNDDAFIAWAIRLLCESGKVDEEDLKLFTAMAGWKRGNDMTARIRRELASAALRLADKHDVTPLLRALMAHKEDAKDPVIPQLVWIAYEKALAKARAHPWERSDGPRRLTEATRRTAVELAWLAEQSPDNAFVRDQIVPKVMRRLVATGQADDPKLCVEFVAKLKDAASREKALDGLAIALDRQTVTAPEAWAALQAEIAKGQ